jgi:hypothetical protein
MNAVVVFTLTISLSFSPFIHTLARAFLRINAPLTLSFSFSISLHARAHTLFRETFDDEAQQHRGEKKNTRFFVR